MAVEKESYFERRAEAELELAVQAIHPAAVRAHYLLAGYYLDQVYGAADEPTQSAIAPSPAQGLPSGNIAER